MFVAGFARSSRRSIVAVAVAALTCASTVARAEFLAGAAKVDITNVDAGPVNDPLFVKALALRSGSTTAVIVTLDAVSVGEIGYIKNDYLPNVRGRIQRELGVAPESVLVNASHCHGIVCTDVEERTFQAVRLALENLVPVKIGAGVGHEDRVSENRRMKLKSGREVDVRHAYSLAPDDEIASVGPIDPEIGVLRFDRLDGRTLAVVYNFACHPIQGVPSGANTADMTGFASQVIEDNASEGAVALFVQGCGGDINPVLYKDFDHPRDAEPLGNMLGLSVLDALRKIETRSDDRLKVVNRRLALPRSDLAQRIIDQEIEQDRLLKSLRGTTLNLKAFMELAVKYNLAEEFPSYNAHRYLHEKQQGRERLKKLDADNRRHIEDYLANIHTMEQLTRTQTNLALLRKHQEQFLAAGGRDIDVEMVGLRVGDLRLVTFPGELTVQIGLNLKTASPHELSFVAGYTNGYIYYAPTAEQLANIGGAQEDSDCILAPAWQEMFETAALEILKGL